MTDVDAAAEALQSMNLSSRAPVEQQKDTEPDLTTLDEAEKRHITAVLRATGGNQTQAAFILGIERKTLARKIRKLEISIDQ